jgi:hypothetical protein
VSSQCRSSETRCTATWQLARTRRTPAAFLDARGFARSFLANGAVPEEPRRSRDSLISKKRTVTATLSQRLGTFSPYQADRECTE